MAAEAGFVSAHATRDLGVAIIGLGGGRTQPGAPIDHAVGLSAVAGPGVAVGPGRDDRPLALIHAASEADYEAAAAAVRAAIAVSAEQPSPRPLELDVVR